MKTKLKKSEMMKTGIFIVCCLFIFSCGRTHCPGFPKHLTDYFPYRKGNVIEFVNQHGDTLSFWVRESWASEKHKSYERCGSPVASFIAPIFFQTNGNPGGILTGSMQVAYDDDSQTCIKITMTNYYWDQDYVNSGGWSELQFFEKTGKDPFDSKNSAIFGNTIVIEEPENQISRVVIVKGKGITGFYDQKHDFQWEVIEKK